VGGSRIVADEEIRASHEALEARDIEAGHRGEFFEFGEEVVLAGAGDEHGLKVVVIINVLSQSAKSFHWPLFRGVGGSDVENRVRTFSTERFSGELSRWNLAVRHAQMEHSGGQVLSSVYRCFFVEVKDFLCPRNLDVVDPTEREVCKASAMFGSRQSGHPGAGGAAVQVEAKIRALFADFSNRFRTAATAGADEIVHVGDAFEKRGKDFIENYTDANVGARGFK